MESPPCNRIPCAVFIEDADHGFWKDLPRLYQINNAPSRPREQIILHKCKASRERTNSFQILLGGYERFFNEKSGKTMFEQFFKHNSVCRGWRADINNGIGLLSLQYSLRGRQMHALRVGFCESVYLRMNDLTQRNLDLRQCFAFP